LNLSRALLFLPLLPLLACVVNLAGGRALPGEMRRTIALTGCGLALLASIGLVIAVSSASDWEVSPVVLYRWAAIPGPTPFVVPVSIQTDGLSALFLLTASATATLIALAAPVAEGRSRQALPAPTPNSGEFGSHSDHRRFCVLLPFLLFAAAMLFLSVNFLQLFFWWQLLSAGASLFYPHGRKLFLVHRLADIAVLAGIAVIWTTFGSLEYADVLADPARFQAVAVFNPATPGLIALCLLAGVVARCAQFPVFGWLEETARGPAAASALLEGAVLLPAGVYLLVRGLPFFDASPNARLLMASVGCFTVLLTSVITIPERDFRQVLGFSSAGHCGFMLLGLGSGLQAGVAAAVFHLVVHSVLKAVLYLELEVVVRRAGGSSEFALLGGLRRLLPVTFRSMLAASLILVSGLWGQNAIAASLWETSVGSGPGADLAAGRPSLAEVIEPEEAEEVLSPFGAEPVRLFRTLMWVAMLSQMLMAFALFRALFLTFHHGPPPVSTTQTAAGDATQGRSSFLFLPLIVFTAGALPVLVDTCHGFDVLFERTATRLVPMGSGDVFVIGPGSLLALVGLVGAWMLYAAPSPVPERMSVALGALTRLGRHRFYLDEFYAFAFSLPLIWFARGLRWLETLAADRLLPRIASGVLWSAEWFAKPLRIGQVQFYAVSLVLSAAVLLAVVSWLRK
jgi:NADH-quinone oxidoreductase subunit L